MRIWRFSSDGRVAIVTGGAGVIAQVDGRALAEAGAALELTGREARTHEFGGGRS